MKLTKANKVRLSSWIQISPKAYKATDFQGNTDIIPKSQVIKEVLDGKEGSTVWISSWLLSKKSLVYGSKTALFDEKGRERKPTKVEVHEPKKIEPQKIKEIEDLKR